MTPKRISLAAFMVLASLVSTQVFAQSGGWTLDTKTIDEERVVVLAHPLPKGTRVEIQASHTLRRSFGSYGDADNYSSTSGWESADPRERSADMRTRVADLIAAGAASKTVLDGFDASHAPFEARIAAEKLPDWQAWETGIVAAEPSKYENRVKVSYEVGGHHGRTGEISIVAPPSGCAGEWYQADRKAPFPATGGGPLADVRAAMQREIEAMVAKCRLNTTAAYWMAGFDGALERAEKHFQTEFPPK